MGFLLIAVEYNAALIVKHRFASKDSKHLGRRAYLKACFLKILV